MDDASASHLACPPSRRRCTQPKSARAGAPQFLAFPRLSPRGHRAGATGGATRRPIQAPSRELSWELRGAADSRPDAAGHHSLLLPPLGPRSHPPWRDASFRRSLIISSRPHCCNPARTSPCAAPHHDELYRRCSTCSDCWMPIACCSLPVPRLEIPGRPVAHLYPT